MLIPIFNISTLKGTIDFSMRLVIFCHYLKAPVPGILRIRGGGEGECLAFMVVEKDSKE